MIDSSKTEQEKKNQKPENPPGNFFPRLYAAFVFSAYVAIFALAYWLAFACRFDFNLQVKEFTLCYQTICYVVALKTIIFFYHQHFNSFWFYATFKDFQVLAKSSLISAAGIFLLGHYVLNIGLPRTIPILDCVFTVFLIGLIRFGWRMLRQEIIPRYRYSARRTLIIGANHQGASLAHELYDHPKLGYRIVGFVSKHVIKLGQQIGHIPVLGHVAELDKLLVQYRIEDVLTFPEVLNGDQMRSVMTICGAKKVRVRIVPSMETRLGNDTIPMRDIKIEDLLKRDPVRLDDSIIQKMLTGRTVLVTGAGGSIGSEICRQIIKYRPKTLCILGRGENRIFFLEQELNRLGFKGNVCPIIADVSRQDRMEQVFHDIRPEVVFHAAAHKHVPLMESNVSEAIRNNVLGTKTVADLSHRFGVSTFVLISTDKAVNPTSVMGASKHIAERYVHALSHDSETRFITTRFGNVLGSTGSVVPIFRRQIALGGPITVTDLRMTRFFMTIPEASQLVLQAAAMGGGGEIFVLDMGEPVRIHDLARDLIRLSGLPEGAIEIREIGLRPGEKLYEELYFDNEKTIKTTHPKLRCASHRRFDIHLVGEQVDQLLDSLSLRPDEIRGLLQEIITEYKPTCPTPANQPETVVFNSEDIRKAG